jgi:glyoxylase-like metal-dependent hydrolase (beta-lactamase superfamily II)
MCTHLHADHVGWNTRLDNGRWVPTFPNARYLIGDTELAHWQAAVADKPGANHGSFHDSVLPVIELGLVTTTRAGDAIADGAKILALPGHSPARSGWKSPQDKAKTSFLRRRHPLAGAGFRRNGRARSAPTARPRKRRAAA